MIYSKKNLREIFGETLAKIGKRDPRVMVLDADLNTSTMTSLFKSAFPDRFIQCGISEANMFSLAAGLAHMGYVPFPSTFAAFVTRKALDPLFMNICCQKLNVKIGGAYPGLSAGECGASHNACDDIAVIRALPHIKVAAPGDANELVSLMERCAAEPGPVYFRIPKTNPPELFGKNHRFDWGKGEKLRDGKDLTILSTGMMTAIALKGSELLSQEGFECTVIHMPSIKPLDEELIVKSAGNTGAVLTMENGKSAGGFGGAVAELLGRERPAWIRSMGIGDEPAASGDMGELLRHYRLIPEGVLEKGLEIIKKKNRDSALPS
jgi:transketolase